MHPFICPKESFEFIKIVSYSVWAAIIEQYIDRVDYKQQKFLSTNSEAWKFNLKMLAIWCLCMQVRKQQSELDMEQQTGSK